MNGRKTSTQLANEAAMAIDHAYELLKALHKRNEPGTADVEFALSDLEEAQLHLRRWSDNFAEVAAK